MTIIPKSLWCLAIVCLTAGTARAADGVQFTQRTTTDGTTITSTVQIAGDKIRAEVAAPGSGGKQAVIFDAGRQLIDVINLERQTYMEVTKAQIDQISAQMQGMMSQMEAAMANMPPEQRAQMEAMMRGRGMGMAAAPKTTYEKTGTDRVAQWACDVYVGTQEGKKVSEICTVPPATLGLTAADAATMRQLADFFKQLVPQASGMLEIGNPDQGFAGIPVRTVLTSGTSSVTSELTDVSRQSFPDATFQVPAGFQKQDFPGPMGRGRGRGN